MFDNLHRYVLTIALHENSISSTTTWNYVELRTKFFPETMMTTTTTTDT